MITFNISFPSMVTHYINAWGIREDHLLSSQKIMIIAWAIKRIMNANTFGKCCNVNAVQLGITKRSMCDGSGMLSIGDTIHRRYQHGY